MIELPKAELDLVAAAIALGAADVAGFSTAERALTRQVEPLKASLASTIRKQIRAGGDPLGAAFSSIRSAGTRRESGATYTPDGIVQAMMSWAREQPVPDRVVDPGVGSARFLSAAGRAFP